jgi:hypothetical protein
MNLRLLFASAAVAAFALAAPSADAGWWHDFGLTGNDTGGIIPWSPAISLIYRDIAAEHCAHYNKIARITSVHRRYGDYVGFECRWPRHYDPVKAYYDGPIVGVLR